MQDGFSVIREVVVVLVPMILSLTVHEFAHAWSAFKLGDNTAKSKGRMTLNPLAHIDFLGTILIPVFSVISNVHSLIGWAKPVPVSPSSFRRSVNMRTGMIITALAGPASNLLLAFILGAVVMFLYSSPIESNAPYLKYGAIHALLVLGDGKSNPMAMLMGRIFTINISLALFNMLPLPPLDGSRLLPLNLQEKLSRYAFLVFLGFILLMNVAGSILWYPSSMLGNAVLNFWGLVF